MKFEWKTLQPVVNVQGPYSEVLQSIFEDISKADISPYTDNDLFTLDLDQKWGARVSLTFQSWRDAPNRAPSFVSMLWGVIDYFDIDINHPMIPMAVTGCLLSEIQHDNPYHNNAHFREVFYIAARLCVIHQNVNRHPSLALSIEDILLLMTVVTIHDFAHDGSSNVVDGVHVPSMLERRSFDVVRPYLEALNIDAQTQELIQLMIISTDVTRGELGRSPAGYVRDIFMAHEHDNVVIANVPDDYQCLLDSHKKTLLCLLLCEADIAMSSSLDYEFSKEMTRLVAKESKILEPSAKTLHGFMEVICHGGFLSRAAQITLGQAFQAILLEVEEDSYNKVLYT